MVRRAVVGGSCEGLGGFLEVNRQPSIAGVNILATLRRIWYRDHESSAREELPLFAGGMGSIAEAGRADVILGAYPGRVSLGVGALRSDLAAKGCFPIQVIIDHPRNDATRAA